MVSFTTTIMKFGEMGEKTGWTYIEVPAEYAQKLKPGNKQSFRVRGRLDELPIKGIALMPMGGGDFIMPLKAELRKTLGKRKGAKLSVKIELDDSPVIYSQDMMDCLADEPKALDFFNKLTPGHRKYFSNWIESAKTDETKAKRIALSVNAMARGLHYGLMIREQKANKNE